MVSVGCFGVGFSVVFHFVFVRFAFGSIWVAGWPPFGGWLPARLAVCSHCVCLFVKFVYFPLWFLGRGLLFGCSSSCSLFFYYLNHCVYQ